MDGNEFVQKMKKKKTKTDGACASAAVLLPREENVNSAMLLRAPRALFFISPLTGFGFVSRGFIVYAHQRAYIYIFE